MLNGREHCNISDNNASDNYYGIYLSSSSNNTITSNTASGNTNFDFHSTADSHNNTIGDLLLSSYPTTVSFTYGNGVGLKGVDTAPSGQPAGKMNISKFVNATNMTADSWLFLNVSYNESDVPADVQESKLRMWKHNGSWHEVAGSGVNEDENYVYANITEFSIFAPLGDVDIIPPAIAIDAPTQSSPANRTGGEQFWVNFTYTELYPANYTVTVGTATAVINSTTNKSVVGGTDRTANESFYLNASAADGWYNVTVEMYDNSLNYNITHQNNSVEKGSYDASISQPENQTTEPSVNATYELNITNTGSFAGTFTLAVTNPGDVDVAALNQTTIANLAVGASQNVTLNVTDASAGTYNVTVNVTSTYSGSEVASTGYIMTAVVGPTLTLDNVNNIASDWGIDFSVNHSVRVTNAAANNVNVTYNVSWITDDTTMGTIAKDEMKWHNQSRSNSTVQKITVKVNANTTTASATNASETFSINITRRDIVITSQPESTQSVGTDATFWINASARDEHSETFTCKADLIKDGIIANTTDVASGNANFSTDESAAGTSNFSIRFYNTSHYNNESTSNSSVTIVGPTLALGNVTYITSDWGINFSMNHSVAVTNATASNVNVTYNISWITDSDTMGTIAEGGMKWHNQTRSNSTVQKITVKVNANTTTASATNDSETFQVNITRREILIISQPTASQTVNPNTTFWINASAIDKHGDELICKADLIRDGSIIENQTITDGNANFSRTEPAEGTFNFSIKFYNTSHYNNKTTSNATMHIVDDTPPASITDLDNPTTEQSRIRWTWTDPADIDFAEVMIYLDGTFKTNVSKGVRNYTATGLDPDTDYTIGTYTVDDNGNINQTGEINTARTLPFSGLQRINVTPDSWTLNINESMNFNATGFDHNDDPIDPENLTFAWYTTPSGIGTLNATTGSVVNFTARHVGRTEIYAVNGSVSSNDNGTDSVWITVNAPPETANVANGIGNATSGNSTAIVWLNNTAVNGTIIIEEIGYPLNETEDIGSRTGLGADTKSVKGANVTVNGSIEVALNATGGYVHIRIEYNESQLGNIDENTLHVYKFVNGTGWVKLVAGNPSYCTANGRNTTADYVWVNVTNCSIFLLAGMGAATPTPSGSSDADGTYPPGWHETPAPAVTAAKAPTASTTATDAPPGERVTPSPTKRPAAAKPTTPAAEGTTAEAKNGAPGFTAVFVIAGMLAVAYAMMRRRG